MNTNGIIWTSEGIHTDGNICIDVKATREVVILGQLHGEHDTFASDTQMSPDFAELIGKALIEAARRVREG